MARLADLEAENERLKVKCAELNRAAIAARNEFERRATELSSLQAFKQGYQEAESMLQAQRDLALETLAKREAELQELKDFLRQLHKQWYDQAPEQHPRN